MNKRKIMANFLERLEEFKKCSEKMKFEDLAEKDLIEFVDDLASQLEKAHAELPRADSKAWTVEFSTAFEVNMTIRADLYKGHPGSYWEPSEPASVEDMEILIEGVGINQQLFDKLTQVYEREIDEQIWDEAEAMEQDYLEAQAENRMAAAEARRDLEEGR